MNFWKSSVKRISDSGLYSLAKDAETRIGSYVAGGNLIDEYVKKQQALLTIIQEELASRRAN
jgi:hypothetical protein